MSEPPPDRYDPALTMRAAPSDDAEGGRPAAAFEWTPEIASGLRPGEAPPMPRPSRALRLLVWIAGIFVVYIIASVAEAIRGLNAAARPSDRGYELGRLVGGIVGPFLLAWLLWAARFVVVRRRGRPADWASPMVPLLAVIIALIGVTAALRPKTDGLAGAGTPVSSASAPSAVMPSAAPSISPGPSRGVLADALAIGAPYRLEAASAAEAKQIGDAFRGDDPNGPKSIEVHRITTPSNGPLGFAVLIDAGVQPGQEAVAMFLLERGMRGTDTTRNHATIGGRDVVTGLSGGAGYAAWVEPPFLKLVIVDDEATAKAIAAKFVRE